MTRSDQNQNLGTWHQKIKGRFPHLDDTAMALLKNDRALFEARVADSHHLTLNEAREEVEDFLYIEGLADEVFNTPAHG